MGQESMVSKINKIGLKQPKMWMKNDEVFELAK